MTPKARSLGVLLLIAVVMLLLPRPLATALEIPQAGSWISLSNLGVLVATYRLGWRWGMASALALTVLTTLAVVSQGQPAAAIPLMAISSLALGLTARWQIQSLLVLLMLTQCFVVAESPVPLHVTEVLAFTGLLALLTTATATATAWAERLGGCLPAPTVVNHSWKRSLAYGLLLGGTTAITSAIALLGHWGLMGGWLMLTPLMVMRPYAHDSWTRSLHRALGTLMGVGLVHLVALVAPGATALPVGAVAFSAATVLAAVKHWHYMLFVAFLSAAVVLFDSSEASILALAQERLEATLLGIGIALATMALAQALLRQRQL
jgi:hypothetical protein